MRTALLPCLCLLAACKSAPAPAVPRRVSPERAEELVRAEVLREIPGLNPQTRLPLLEITTPEAWSAMGVQLFQVRSDAVTQGFETFAVRKGEVLRLGTGFGGMGVGSTLVTDLDGDRSPELVFVYSWGSGRHRSQVGALRIAGQHMSTLACEWSSDGDSFLVRGELGVARLVNAESKIGTLRFVDGVLRVVVD